MKDDLKVQDRVQLSGGYDQEPAWLSGRSSRIGVLEAFVPGQGAEPAALVRLDEPTTFGDTTGSVVVLELRHEGARWVEGSAVHVELCDFEPEPAPWQERRQGVWVECAATIRRLHQ